MACFLSVDWQMRMLGLTWYKYKRTLMVSQPRETKILWFRYSHKRHLWSLVWTAKCILLRVCEILRCSFKNRILLRWKIPWRWSTRLSSITVLTVAESEWAWWISKLVYSQSGSQFLHKNSISIYKARQVLLRNNWGIKLGSCQTRCQELNRTSMWLCLL